MQPSKPQRCYVSFFFSLGCDSVISCRVLCGEFSTCLRPRELQNVTSGGVSETLQGNLPPTGVHLSYQLVKNTYHVSFCAYKALLTSHQYSGTVRSSA